MKAIRSTRRIPHTLHRILLSLLVCLVCVRIASGQAATGFPPFASFSGGPDVLDNANGNVHISVPVFSRAGRGLPYSYALQYDSSVWSPYGASGFYGAWPPAVTPQLLLVGWTASSTGNVGSYDFSQVQECCPGQHCNPDLGTGTYYNRYSGWVYIDASNTQHAFPASATVNDSSQLCPYGTGSWSTTTTTSDGSGLTMTVNATPAATFVYDIHGNTLDLQNSIVKDRNGNELTPSGDTLGTIPLTISTSGNPMTYTYTAPSGQQAVLKVYHQGFTFRTNFGCSGVTEYGPTSQSLVTEIDLPDYNATTNPNARYTFTYEATPGYSGDVTGRLASITFPTGGTISYSYSGPNNGITCADGSTATLTRTTPDGTWTYARSGGTSITDPQGNQTNLSFQGIYEIERQIYQGSVSPNNLLLTVFTCYDGGTPPCTNSFSSITQKTVYTQWPSGLESETNTLYNSVGLPTEEDDYDYGSGGPGPLLAKVLTSYATLGNYIADRPSSVTVQNGGGTVIAQTTYCYDEGTPSGTTTCNATGSPTPTSGTPQHVSITGSRGNVTTVAQLVSGSNYLGKKLTFYDTGSVNTATDANSAVTTYNYPNATSTCGNTFPTSVSEPLSLSESMTWNCNGAVMTQLTDEDGNNASVSYTDPYYWRPASTTDLTGAVTNLCYGLMSSSTGICTINPTQIESTLNFNSNNSTVDLLTTLDALGRTHVQQQRQSPTATTFDSIETDYDLLGHPERRTLPYSGSAGQTNSTAPAVSTTYDALGRVLSTTDANNGSTAYVYSNNDVLVKGGPAPTGENLKQRQLEYDGLGRLTSVCEITAGTTPWPSGSCAENTSATGYLTKYTFDALGNLTGVTQNAQSASNQQTRSYTFDGMSRLTSETNPENGVTAYTFDTIASGNCAGTYNGDLIKRVDGVGNVVCFTYDTLHRKLSATYPSGAYASVTPSKYFVYDSATVNFVAMANAKTHLAEAYTCTTCPGTKITDVGLSYTSRGEVSDVYESTPHSNGYYHITQTYWPHGAPSQLSNLAGLPAISYGGTIGSTVGLDGEGRITQVTASSGQNPVTGVTYNGASLPTQVNFGSGDNDVFAYDSNTLRVTQFTFNVGTQSQYLNGGLTWNANGSLGQLAITDQFNGADTQTCNYTHDDLARIASANCGSAANQTFSFDPFGNINKSGSPYSFQPAYSASTNRMTSIAGFTPTYDSNGNVTNDNSHTYAWDADGNSISVDSVGLTFDALDRMVEQSSSGTYAEIVYGPAGGKLGLMNGQTLTKAFVSLPGQAVSVYTGSGLDHYRHSDWLGSTRLTSSPSRNYVSSIAYGPYGETYGSSGATDPSFTGMNLDTVSTDYDFLYREYSIQGRWPSPDPAGLAAVDSSSPQSWNRYSYVLNSPCNLVDPFGLATCNLNILLNNQAGLNSNQLQQIKNQIEQIWGQTDDGKNNWLNVQFVSNTSSADTTLTLSTSGFTMTLCGPYAICGNPWVNINSAHGVSANSTNLAIGSAAAHELGHWLGLNNGIFAHEPLTSGNLMVRDLGIGGAYRPNDPASAVKLNPPQIARALKNCKRWPSPNSGGGGGGGGPADPTHGGGGAATGSSGSGSTWFNLYYSWLLLQPTEVVTWHFVF